MDRRYIRTEKLLISALLALIAEQAFQDITVNDIVERADIARKTFYAHYANKRELLWHSLAYHFRSIEETLPELQADTLLMGNKPLSYPVFKHVEAYSVFYKGMFSEQGEIGFIFQFLDYIAQQSYQKLEALRRIAPVQTVPPHLIAQMLSGALLSSLRWWLNDDMQDTPEQMAYRFSQIIAPGVLQSMGLDE